ncbi:MAG TPA: hypothetical protein VNY05_07375 [Candidatus Acidoferrales bacterium]|jgi:hypothetical protein|nr:hypothetical protein [Candidatus Acidoferrales bacterium]
MRYKGWNKTRSQHAIDEMAGAGRQTSAAIKAVVLGGMILAANWLRQNCWRDGVVVTIAPALYAIGVTAMYERQYYIAAGFYVASIVYGASKIMRWEDAKGDVGTLQRRIASGLVIMSAAVVFSLSYWWIDHTKAQREMDSRSVTVPLNKDSESKSEVFLNPGEHPCELMTIMPIPLDKHTTWISEQLMPPTCDDDSAHSTVVKGVTVAFDNRGSSTDHNIRVKMVFGNSWVKSVKCDARIDILEGPEGREVSGGLYLVARELFPDEGHSCHADFVNRVEAPTVQSWLDRFGSVKGASDLYNTIDVYTHRINFGVLERVTGGPRPYRRTMTINPK